MTANEYQKLAFVTAGTTDAEEMLMNGALGLNGEAGEVADIIKKYKFQGHELDREHLAEEISDVMWYIALLATALDTNLESIMEMNIDKLKARFPDGFDVDKSVNR